MASVRQHGNRWQVRWRDEHGRQVVESFEREQDAQAAARKVEARTVLDGRPPVEAVADPNALTVAKWWARWEPSRKWKPTTRAGQQSNYRCYIGPVFAKVPLTAITAADIDRFHRALERKGLAPTTIAGVHATFQQLLAGAERDGLIDRNPTRFARLPRSPKAPRVALTDDQAKELRDSFATTTPRLVGLFDVCLHAGLRRGEAAGLTWDRVDLDGKLLTVDRQLDPDQRTSDPPVWTTTKTATTRVVPITDSLAATLREHRQMYGIGVGHLVFTTANGTPWARATLGERWRAAAKGLALPAAARGYHVLRHTCGSRLLDAGIPPASGAAMLGHTVETFLSIYSHEIDVDAGRAAIRAALEGR